MSEQIPLIDLATTPKAGDRIAVWFSCGAASAIAAKVTLEQYKDCDVRVVYNPVAEEDEDNLRFLADVEKWLGIKIERNTYSKFPSGSAVEVWEHERAMVFPHGAPCTRALKKRARQEWEKLNNPDWHVLGFVAEEKKRHDEFVLTERSNLLPVLIDAGISKQDCFDILASSRIAVSRVYSWGLPNGNCIGCVKATSPTYWNLIRKIAPNVFASRAEQSRRLGVRLVKYKGPRIFLDELPPDAKGRPLKKYSIDCGIFCEEWRAE